MALYSLRRSEKNFHSRRFWFILESLRRRRRIENSSAELRRFRLARYTSFSELFPLLAAGILPLVKVKEISQKFDSGTLTVENSVQFAGPLATTAFSTNATFEVRSPKRVQIKFEEGIISTPQLTDAIEIPEYVEFLGQKIALAPFKGLITSIQNAATSVVKSISEQPPIKFPIRTDRAQSWLLTTYLDDDLRISRGDGSSVFVLIKEGSPLLPPS